MEVLYNYFAVNSTACAIAGIERPCCDDVGDINAPVAQNNTRDNVPFCSSLRIFEQTTDPLHPQPDPPAPTP